jgi:hypothetical protein
MLLDEPSSVKTPQCKRTSQSGRSEGSSAPCVSDVSTWRRFGDGMSFEELEQALLIAEVFMLSLLVYWVISSIQTGQALLVEVLQS